MPATEVKSLAHFYHEFACFCAPSQPRDRVANHLVAVGRPRRLWHCVVRMRSGKLRTACGSREKRRNCWAYPDAHTGQHGVVSRLLGRLGGSSAVGLSPDVWLISK
jgi:hypothetical protein